MVLKELCALRGVSGDERRVRDFIRERIESCADSVRVDRMGNLIAFKCGTGENRCHILLAAHLDEVGLVVRGINDSGLLSYSPVGEIDPRMIVSKPVRVGDDALPGVIGAKAIHLQSAQDRATMLPHSQLYVEIGAKDKASAEKLTELGDVIAFESKWMEFGDGMVKARALESRAGCMTLMSLLEGEYPCDITCVFTVQSQTGSRGALAAAYGVESDAALVLDAVLANDLDDFEAAPQVCKVKEGAVVTLMDRAAIASVPLYAKLKALAREAGIPCQDVETIPPKSDAGAFQRAGGPRPVCVVGVPCRYKNTPSNVMAFTDIEAQYRLIDAFLTSGGTF